MTPQPSPAHDERIGEFQRKHRTGLVTLVFTDMAGSTGLKQQLGDRAGAEVFRRHHQAVRDTLWQFPQSEEIETAGDSFFLAFATPSEAVQFALLLQVRLRGLSDPASPAGLDRIGIHLGEVVLEAGPESRKSRNIFGLSIDICARVMGLAEGGQILLTRAVFDNARQGLKGEASQGVKELSWLNHGAYLLKGIEEPVEVCEVGETGLAPLQAPADSEKARRRISPDSEPVLGWRPALGQVVPHTQWALEQKLGEGGFGEVWLGRHQTMKERRVFKFCFRADRARSLKREMTLFRLIRERIGDHPNVVALREVYFDAPPFYVVMDHVEGSDLKAWCESRGGVEKVPLETKLEIIAQIADALHAAHDAGVIHRDVKPGNILVRRSGRREEALTSSAAAPETDEPPHAGCYDVMAKLTDFGIGQVVSEEALKGVTRAGFTETIVAQSSSSQTGSQMYMAPELLAGKPASIRSDIYSLGVVLYQLLVNDFSRPLTTDWAADIADPLLQEDLQRCFAGNPEQRFAGAGQLAGRLRDLPGRQEALARRQAELAARERAAYRMGVMRTAAAAFLVLVVVSLLAAYAWSTAKKQRLNAYVADMNVAGLALQEHQVARARELVEKYLDPKPWEEDLRGFEWRMLWQQCQPDEHEILTAYQDWATCAVFSPEGRLLATGSFDGQVRILDVASRRIVKSLEGFEPFIETRSIAFSPNGKLLAVKAGARMKVWRTDDWTEACPALATEPKPFANQNDAVAFSPDGATLAARVRGGVGFWNTATWEGPVILKGTNEMMGTILEYSSDGKHLAITEWNKLYVHDAQSAARPIAANLTREVLDPVKRVLAVAFSREFMAAGYRDGLVRLWRAGTWEELANVQAHLSNVGGLDFSPDGQTLITGGEDHVLKLWDVKSLLKRTSLNQAVKPAAVLKGHARSVVSVSFSPGGDRIVSTSQDGTVRLWNALAQSEDRILSRSARPLWFSADGTQLVVQTLDETLHRWHVLDRRDLGRIDTPAKVGLYTPVAISSDGQTLALARPGGGIEVRNPNTGQSLATLPGDGSEVRNLLFSPSNDLLAAESKSGNQATLRVWDVRTQKEVQSFRDVKDYGGPRALFAFSPDDTRLAFVGSDSRVRIGGLPGAVRTLSDALTDVNSLAISPDGRWLAVGANDTIWLGRVRAGPLAPGFKVPQSGIADLAFAPDGKTLVSSSFDNVLTFWSVALGKELMSLPNVFHGHVRPHLFAPAGNALAVTASEMSASRGEVELWAVPTLAEIDAAEKRKRTRE